MDDQVKTDWSSSNNAQWVECDITQLSGILANEKELQDRVSLLEKEKEITYKDRQKPAQFTYPELMSAGEESVGKVISGLMDGITMAASVAGITPCAVLNDRYSII